VIRRESGERIARVYITVSGLPPDTLVHECDPRDYASHEQWNTYPADIERYWARLGDSLGEVLCRCASRASWIASAMIGTGEHLFELTDAQQVSLREVDRLLSDAYEAISWGPPAP